MKHTDGIRAFTTEGVVFLHGLTQRQRSIVGTHWNTIRWLLEDGNEAPLAGLAFTLRHTDQGLAIGGYTLQFDPNVIEREAARGDVRFESIYEADR